MRSRRVLAFAAAAFVTACGASSDSSTAVIKPPPVTLVATSVSLSPGATSVEAGASVKLLVEVRDQFGALMTGQTSVWSTSNALVATVDAAGSVTGRAVGTAAIGATVAGVVGLATVTVNPVPVGTVSIAVQTGAVVAGQTLQLVATLTDHNGAPATGRLIAWTSSVLYVGRVDNTGKITAVGGGTTTITATSEGVSGTTAVLVGGQPAPLPVITGVTPSSLVPGTTATINGSGFDAVLAYNAVTVRGAPAALLTSSPTQISFTVPCVGSGAADVQVAANTRNGVVFAHSVATTQRTIALGQAIVIADPTCNELAPTAGNARYIVAVFSDATSENALTDFELGGNVPLSVIATRAPAPLIATTTVATERAAGTPGPDAARDRAHWEMLERNRAIYQEARSIIARQPLLNRSASHAAAAVPVVGDPRNFYFTYSSNCNDSTRVMHSKALYVGAKAIIWEDTTNTLLAVNDTALAGYYQRLGKIFDQDQYEVVTTNFGDPLLRDGATDNDGHLSMVFSERLNATTAAAYVIGCDQYPRTVYAGSNFGQNFYGTVPTTKGSNLNNTLYADGWFNFMARTVVHEVKHIASLSARVANGAPSFEESWLEEGTARHAEELWARQYLEHVAWKGNTGFGTASTNGIFCDFHPENAVCNSADALRRPGYGMRRHFNEIRNKLQQPWNWSLYNDGTGQSGSVFYQTSWSFVRYVIDRYGASDAAFLTKLTSSMGRGLNNLSIIAGASADQLVGGWSLALYADDYPGLASPSADIQFPTWNLRSIYAGLHTDASWAGLYPAAFPLQPAALTFGSFTAQRAGLRGGAQAYFEISGTSSGAQLLAVRGLGGGLPSPFLRMAIARLQ